MIKAEFSASLDHSSLQWANMVVHVSEFAVGVWDGDGLDECETSRPEIFSQSTADRIPVYALHYTTGCPESRLCDIPGYVSG